MDLVLEFFDTYLFDYVYAAAFPKTYHVPTALERALAVGNYSVGCPETILDPHEFYGAGNIFFQASEYAQDSLFARDHILRQALSIFLITWAFGDILYYLTATFSYYFVFDRRVFEHPKYLKDQMKLEISHALNSIPYMVLLTVPWFIAEIRGYSKMYWNISDYGIGYLILQFPMFIMFTDCGIYFIHKYLHHPILYKRLHKPHHKWLVTTPYASHAFHPVDGYAQSLPYHIFPFLFPFHKVSYLLLFTFVNIWTVLIHDGEYLTNNPMVNGAACHTVHHLYFNYNYGQFTTLWDRIGGSYRQPDFEFFDKSSKMDKKTWSKQSKASDVIRLAVESENDDRIYANDDKKVQ